MSVVWVPSTAYSFHVPLASVRRGHRGEGELSDHSAFRQPPGLVAAQTSTVGSEDRQGQDPRACPLTSEGS